MAGCVRTGCGAVCVVDGDAVAGVLPFDDVGGEFFGAVGVAFVEDGECGECLDGGCGGWCVVVEGFLELGGSVVVGGVGGEVECECGCGLFGLCFGEV